MRIRALLAVILLCVSGMVLSQTVFNVPPEFGQRYSSNVRAAPTYVDARVLAANTSETHTVPAGIKWVLFSPSCDFYAKLGASAAVPAADVTDGSSAELNPAGWYIEGVTQFTLIAPSTCVVTLSFYR